ncbi:hypothetical protein LCGC14_0345320 [marine sediment metagenome]|uniref:Uncharacterized protein n=1 Tax=marine sediment metagenome TaxID=412755 RepID=A0A0F9VZS9_9ZZZZ|nr:hypothetical protein [Maribacter sp.]
MYPTFDIIGKKTAVEINSIKKMVSYDIPKSYLNFNKTYDYGIIAANIEYLRTR